MEKLVIDLQSLQSDVKTGQDDRLQQALLHVDEQAARIASLEADRRDRAAESSAQEERMRLRYRLAKQEQFRLEDEVRRVSDEFGQSSYDLSMVQDKLVHSQERCDFLEHQLKKLLQGAEPTPDADVAGTASATAALQSQVASLTAARNNLKTQLDAARASAEGSTAEGNALMARNEELAAVIKDRDEAIENSKAREEERVKTLKSQLHEVCCVVLCCGGDKTKKVVFFCQM